jgi:hypothetical protein
MLHYVGLVSGHNLSGNNTLSLVRINKPWLVQLELAEC